MKIRTMAVLAAGKPPQEWDAELGELNADEVEIDTEVCALCHSDLHMIDNDWGISRYPLVPGHEIVGHVAAVGENVAGFDVGDRVGLGWQCGACGTCLTCRTARPHLCTGGKRKTCVDQFGGFAQRVRSHQGFVYPIPPSIRSEHAAPLMCAGLTVFSALERHLSESGMRVGVIGVGGLGHLAVQFAAKMGSTVVAFDVSAERLELARTLGADQAAIIDGHRRSGELDLLISTTSADLDWNTWLDHLAVGGTMCLLGYPSEAITIAADRLLDGQKNLTGSVIGSPATMHSMLAFAAEHRIVPMIERMPMTKANEAITRLRKNDVRFRMVLDADL